MKRRNFLTGAGVVACGATVSTDSARAENAGKKELRVLCYNVHYCKGTDGRFDIERIARVIRDEKPDLVALQEVDVRIKRSGMVHQLEELARLTGMKGLFGPTQHYHGGLYGNGILSRLPVLDVLIEPLPYTPGSREVITYPRGLIAATVDLGSERRLRIVSTHFQHVLEEDRVAQADACNRLFGEPDPVPTILAGDFNAVPGSAPMKELGKFWQHAAGIGLDVPADPAVGGWNIDHILIRRSDRLSAKEARVIDETTASDHRPILTLIEEAI